MVSLLENDLSTMSGNIPSPEVCRYSLWMTAIRAMNSIMVLIMVVGAIVMVTDSVDTTLVFQIVFCLVRVLVLFYGTVVSSCCYFHLGEIGVLYVFLWD